MPDRHPAPLVLGALFVLMGLVVGTGGVWLIALGGSWYYLPGGLVLVLTGLLLLQRNPAALWVHAGLLTATLAWSVWEAGLDWWALVARGDVLFVLALFMLTPWFTRGLVAATRQPARQGLTAALGAFTAVAAVAWLQGSGHGPGAAIAHEAPPLATPSAEAAAHAHALEGRLAPPLPAPQPAPSAQAANGPREAAWPVRADAVPAAATAHGLPAAGLHAAQQVFFCTPQPALVAMDAATGTPLWRHALEPGAAVDCDALAYQPPALGKEAAAAPPKATHAVLSRPAPSEERCDARLFVPLAPGRLLVLNPLDGRPCRELGDGLGVITLQSLAVPGRAAPPPVLLSVAATRDRLLVATTARPDIAAGDGDGNAATEARRARLSVQAYDLTTGTAMWHWHPPPGLSPTPGRQPLAHIDDTLGLLYMVGTPGSGNVQGTAVAALELASGRLRWQFESENPAGTGRPIPVRMAAPQAHGAYFADLRQGTALIPALVQPTADGQALVLDRRSGTPLPAPALPPTGMGSRTPSGAELWGVTLLDHLACRIAFERLRFQDRFSPRDVAAALPGPAATLGRFHWQHPPAAAHGAALRQVASSDTGAAPALPQRQAAAPLLVLKRSSAPAEAGRATLVRLQPLRSPLGLDCQVPGAGKASVLPPSPAGAPQGPAPTGPMTFRRDERRPQVLVQAADPGSPDAASADPLVASQRPES